MFIFPVKSKNISILLSLPTTRINKPNAMVFIYKNPSLIYFQLNNFWFDWRWRKRTRLL